MRISDWSSDVCSSDLRGDPKSLSGPKVTTIVKESDGVIWVGTQESGLNRVTGFTDDGIPRFKRYPAQPGNEGALQNERISCMLSETKGRLWVGTYKNGRASCRERVCR